MNETPEDLCIRNPSISLGFKKIVEKLLSKEPDDRYQSAESLHHDLKQIDIINEKLKNKSGHILLGSSQEGGGFSSFVGREEELKKLDSHLQKISSASSGGVILVEGGSGVGKSRLLREFIKKLQITNKKNPLILWGKAVFNDPMPLTVIKDAIDHFIRTEIYLKNDEEKKKFTEKFKAALGEFAPVLKSLTPLVARIIGSEAMETEAYSQDIYQNAIAEVIVRLSQEFYNGLLIFIVDDVQWVDDLSLEILKKVILSSKKQKILIFGTCRDDSSSALRKDQFLHAVDDVKALIGHIVLTPLTETSVFKYVQVRLSSQSISADIVSQLYQRSHGNPFATEEYLVAMLESGYLKPSWGSWFIDEERAKDFNLPTDVIQLVIFQG